MIEKNKIYCIDCLEGMKQLPDNFVDLTITSPPYNVGTSIRGNFYKQYSDDLTTDQYYNWIKEVMQETIRITKYYTFFNFQLLKDNKLAYLQLMSDFKENIKDIIVWNKAQCQPSIQPTQLSSKFEFILVLSKKENCSSRVFERANFNNRKVGQINTNVIEGNNAGIKEGLTEKGDNKATFPLYFVNWFLDKFAQPGDTIFDPFNGSGTTTLCSKLKGYNYLGFELEQAQVDLAKSRLNQTSLFSRGLS
jgi:DNA modification methylase